MKREIRWGVWLMVLAVAAGAGAAEKKWNLSDWLKNLDAKIRRVQDKHRQERLSVAAVRGSKQGDTRKLYWKGKKGAMEVSVEELAAFKSAVDLAKDEKSEEAQAALSEFIEKYPKSAMKNEAESTRALLAEATAAPPAETPAP